MKEIIQLIISVIVILCELVFAGMIIYTRWIGDINKSQAFFRQHRGIQITVLSMSMVGFFAIIIKIFMM